ncbi:uncharacterized protein ACO6RY_19248 [Pungitius sinensis]
MEYCFLTGFLVVLLIQRCKSEGASTSIQSSTAVPLQDGPATPQEPEPAAEVVPAVAPPSLKEVQQAVQEASEQVETRGAEEVLKVLLERVVEAAWGQVEATGEVKADQEAVRQEEALEPEKEEVETNAEVLEKVVEGEDVAAEGEYNNAGEEQEVAVVDALEYVSEEGEGVEEREGETGVGVEAEGVEVINKSLGIESPHRTVEDTVAALEETGGHTLAEAGARVGYEDVLPEENGAAETERREGEETPAVVEVAGGGEAEAVPGSNTSLASADVQQIGDARGNEDNQVDEMEGDAMVPHSDDLEIESTQTVVGEHVEEINIVEDAKEPEVEDQQGHLVVGGVAAQDEGAEVGEESPIKGESVELANEGGDLQAGEEEQRALETSHGGEKEDQEVLLISAPEAQDGGGASVEPSPEDQAFTPGTFLGEGQPEENALGEEAYNNGNEIIYPTDDLLPHGAVEAQPAPDHSVKVVLAETPQAEGEEPGEADELVEEAAANKETGEQGLEPWKIGAISAAAFLVLETIIIIVYVLKCRNINSTAGIQRACEEGCVEPEDATGGDCSDDTLPASNGDAQQIAALDAFEAASSPARNKEQKEEERGVAMADLPPSSAEESACAGPGPDPSQDLRTSIL